MEIRFLRQNRFWWFKGGLALVSILTVVYWWSDLRAFFLLIGDRNFIVDYLQQYGPLGPVMLFCILMLQVFLAVIPGHAFIVAGGYIYGLLLGSIITLISTVIAGQLAFLLTRHTVAPWLIGWHPDRRLTTGRRWLRTRGLYFSFSHLFYPYFRMI